MESLDKESSIKNICLAMCCIAKAWAANSNNVKVAHNLQILFANTAKSVRMFISVATPTELKDFDDIKNFKNILKEAINLAQQIAPDEMAEIGNCSAYSLKLYQMTKTFGKGISGDSPIDLDNNL